jgi:hypothetical protein
MCPSGRSMLGRSGAAAIAVVLTLASVCVGEATDVGRLDGQCRSLLRRQVFDCTCTADFLETQLGPAQGEIVMLLWVLAANGDNQNQEILNLYLRFGRNAIDQAVMDFHRHRDGLRAFCMQGAPNIAD